MTDFDDNKIKDQGASRVAITGMAWSFAERISAQLVTLIVTIVLARLLSPDEYAVVAIVFIFVMVADIFVTAGFGSALVQKYNTDNIDFSSTFYFSICFSFLIYAVLFFSAPLIAEFYDMEILTPVVRVMSIRIIFASVNSVQQAYVSRMLQFRKFFYSTFWGAIASAILGIGMAYAGYGVWALVAQYLSNVIVSTVILSLISGWRPEWVYSSQRMKGLFSYGWKVMVANVFHSLGTQARSLVLGKVASPRELSFYNQGEKFPALFINNVETSIQKVMAPILSKEQNDLDRVLDMTRKSMQISTIIIWPLLMGLAAMGDSVIEILFSAKWLGSVPYLKLICLAYLFYPVGETHIRTLKALGRSDITLWTISIAEILNLLFLVAAIFLGFDGKGIVVTWILSSILMAVINGVVNKYQINYKFKDQILDLLATIICCIVMYVVIDHISQYTLNLYLKALLQIVAGGVTYVIMSLLLNKKNTLYLSTVITNYYYNFKHKK